MKAKKITTKAHAKRFNKAARTTKRINKGKFKRGGIRL